MNDFGRFVKGQTEKNKKISRKEGGYFRFGAIFFAMGGIGGDFMVS